MIIAHEKEEMRIYKTEYEEKDENKEKPASESAQSCLLARAPGRVWQMGGKPILAMLPAVAGGGGQNPESRNPDRANVWLPSFPSRVLLLHVF
ncbi:hypothetical protein M514_19033 [Trichuris suis]|uniref:Uncharacterized protein n=1 Tax=Trichuris suis TaxID=68888 RepID=A0A085NH46_9BILA|nr:hypothetical protein M514_19033 [Trichuris suis]